MEICIMAVAAFAFWLDSVPLLIVLLFMMGVQSSLFGPLKFGILPQILDDHELLGGNGLVEMGTFLAILLGTALGGVLIGVDDIGHKPGGYPVRGVPPFLLYLIRKTPVKR